MVMDARSIPVRLIGEKDRQRMLNLMQCYYENVCPHDFIRDLEKKDAAVMLSNGAKLCGFSTYVLLRQNTLGRRFNVVFSGDTIVDKAYRNSVALPFTLARIMLSIADREPDSPLYWLLISKGYTTFRFLPVFFKDYFPAPGREASDIEADLLQRSVAQLFPGKLDAKKWVLPSTGSSQRLRPGVADITETKRASQEIAFFEARNPGHSRGDELVCLARFDRENLKPSLLKRIARS